MSGNITHRMVVANGINMHVAEQGSGPLVLLCHGFPETWYSWRHQLAALAGAGFRAVAPDMRGYAQTDAPDDIESYSILHLVGDVVGLVHALGETDAVIVGHDWGATVAWMAALVRPDIFRAVAALSIPLRPRGPTAPLAALRAAGLDQLYWFYFQKPGVAEAELERDVSGGMRKGIHTLSGDAPQTSEWSPMIAPGSGFLDKMIAPKHLPPWFGEEDLATVSAEFKRTGFRGALNWYRNLDRNWALTGAFEGRRIEQPALFIAGTRDITMAGPNKAAIDKLATTVPGLKRQILIDGAGHWVGEERPSEVNAALIDFLRKHVPPAS